MTGFAPNVADRERNRARQFALYVETPLPDIPLLPIRLQPPVFIREPHLHCTSSPPPEVSFSSNNSISSCVSQLDRRTRSLSRELEARPAVQGHELCPSSSKSTVITVPFGPGPSSP